MKGDMMNGFLNPRLNMPGPELTNALLIGQQMKEQRVQRAFQNRLAAQRANVLAQQAGREQSRFGWEKEDRKLKQQAFALEQALRVKGQKNRQAIFQKFGGTGITFDPESKEMQFRLTDGTEITVPENAEPDVIDYVRQGLQDRTWFTDEDKANQAMQFLIPRGVTIKRPLLKETQAEKLDLFRKKQQIKREEAAPKEPTEAEKKMPYKGQVSLKSLTHDKDGNPLDKVSRTDIAKLSETLGKYGQEVAHYKIPKVIRDWKSDIPDRDVYMVIKKDQEVEAQTLIDLLVDDYGYTPEEALSAIRKMVQGQ